MKTRFLIAIILLILFSTYKPQKLFFNSDFIIKEITIENNLILKKNNIKNKLSFLYDKNLIFLKTSDLTDVIKKIDLLESFEIKKIYPDKLKIKIFEKKLIAILQNKKKKIYISENFDLINYTNIESYKNLPIVFGKKENFEVLYKDLKKINFPLDSIKKYYLFESKRWDLEVDSKIIKLPLKNYTDSLENFMSISKNSSYDKYNLFDYRIKNQLILK